MRLCDDCIHADICINTTQGNCEDYISEKLIRPKGEWIWLGDNPNPNHKWSCSKCGRGVKEQENFCPNCGAKMKGGADMRKGG